MLEIKIKCADMQWIVQFSFCIIYYAKYIFVKSVEKTFRYFIALLLFVEFLFVRSRYINNYLNQLLLYPYAGSYLADRLL